MRPKLPAVWLLLPALLMAQDRAAINGSVTDPTGALVTGAQVELNSASNGLHRTTMTNEKGLFDLTPLPVGTWTAR